jgi:hypothetical protein
LTTHRNCLYPIVYQLPFPFSLLTCRRQDQILTTSRFFGFIDLSP